MSDKSDRKEADDTKTDNVFLGDNGHSDQAESEFSSAPPDLHVDLSRLGKAVDDAEESTIVDMKRLVAGDIGDTISHLPLPADPLLLGKYTVVYPLTTGKTATVNVGREVASTDVARLVAIKFIHTHLAEEESFIEAFRDETNLRKKMRHPNVARVYDFSDQESRCFTVEELVVGQSLETLISRTAGMGREIPPVIAAEIFTQICLGLHEAYALAERAESAAEESEPSKNEAHGTNFEGLTNGNLVPSNIMISYQGAVKLVDFGISWPAGRLSEDTLDKTDKAIEFISPEQILGEKRGPQGDIFSLGALLYVATTGNRPFNGKNLAARLKNLLTTDYLAPRATSPQVDTQLQEIIQRAMSLFPTERFNSLQEMGNALETYAETARHRAEMPVLSDLMQEVFAGEFKDHETKIQAYYRHLSRGSRRQTGGSFKKIFSKPSLKIFGSIAALVIIALLLTKFFVLNGEFSFDGKKKQKPHASSVTSSETAEKKGSALATAEAAPTDKNGIERGDSKGSVSESPIKDSQTGDRASDLQNKDSSTPAKSPAESSTPAKATGDQNKNKDGTNTPPQIDPKKPEKSIVTITIEGLEPGAVVFVGKEEMTTPLELPASEKPIRLRVEAPGYKTVKKRFTPDEDKTLKVKLIKEKQAMASPSPKAKTNDDAKASKKETKRRPPENPPKKKKRQTDKPREKKRPAGFEANPFS